MYEEYDDVVPIIKVWKVVEYDNVSYEDAKYISGELARSKIPCRIEATLTNGSGPLCITRD